VAKAPPVPGVADLRTFLKALGVASFKIPEQVFAVEALPKNAAGKTLKQEIRVLILGAAEQSNHSITTE
jgi:non-ribosomal peptide synthetase component E (peptide arylation enzyme)